MPITPEQSDALYFNEVMLSGDETRLVELERLDANFPGGRDSYTNTSWIIMAAASAPTTTIRWMIDRGIALDCKDDDGDTVVHATLERDQSDRLEVLELVLKAGAPVNTKGINDWTPAHMAAARNDVEALRILVRHGADLSLKTDIDNYATPLEEARHMNRYADLREAIAYLESIEAPEESTRR